MYQINDRVTLNDPRSLNNGSPATVMAVKQDTFLIQMDNAPQYAFWYETELLSPILTDEEIQAMQDAAFDAGTGYGG